MADTDKCTEDGEGVTGRWTVLEVTYFGSDPNIYEWNLLSKEKRYMSL